MTLNAIASYSQQNKPIHTKIMAQTKVQTKPEVRNSEEMTLLWIPHHKIWAGNNPRSIFEPKKMEELANSIREQGFLQNFAITVERDTDPDSAYEYRIVAGERRWRAFGVVFGNPVTGTTDQEMPCYVMGADASKKTAYTIAIIENLIRDNLKPIEEARAFRRALDEFFIPEATEQLAEMKKKDKKNPLAKKSAFELGCINLATSLGVKQAHRITDRIALLNLTSEQQQLMEDGVISKDVAFYAAQISDPECRAKYIKAALPKIDKNGEYERDGRGNIILGVSALSQAKSLKEAIVKKHEEDLAKKNQQQIEQLEQGLDPVEAKKQREAREKALKQVQKIKEGIERASSLLTELSASNLEEIAGTATIADLAEMITNLKGVIKNSNDFKKSVETLHTKTSVKNS